MESDTETLPSGMLFEDRYAIEGELGSGSFSRVYRARQLSTGQTVAIKLLDLSEGSASSSGHEAERFRRETRICAALSHPNVVPLLDAGETAEGRLYAVFAYVPGETLEAALAREGALSVPESLRLLTQVLEALAAAHVKGIVHRDLKPANLMLSAAGVRRSALVLDFGVGGLAEGRRRQEWQTLTQTREFLGTPLYASPEQLAGEPATPRSDLYAWGLVFLECLTGRHPFAEQSASERLLSGGGSVEIPEWLVGHRLGELLAGVTAREPARRDLSAEALIEALDAIARSELPVAPEVTPPPRPLAGEGERRHLTVMFCDLFGSTALSQQLDAESYREIVRAYQARGAEAVERYEGRVVQYLGDGLLVYFGHPQAHEDDAERAIRAGREVLRGLELLSAQTRAKHGVPITARVGIHTGPVVVGEMGGGETREILALGDTPNIAARLEGFAEPGTVVVSDATLRLVSGLFVTEDRGIPELKGIAEPIRVHRIVQASGIRSRLDRAPRLTPFVGREQELGLLLEGFERAQEEGRGQALLVSGEAGIGKSRLVNQLRESLHGVPHSWLECHSSPYAQGSAFHPLIEMLERTLDLQEEDAAPDKLRRLEDGLAQAGLELAEAVPLMASLLSLRLPERYAPLQISPQLQRQKTLETLLAWLLALAEKQPVVLVVEDLHWTDPSTLEWLGLAIEQCPTAKLLLLLTYRPEFEAPWPAREHLHPITLGRLGPRQARELVTGASGDAGLSLELTETIAARSDGVPLFAEELAKGVAEAEGASPQQIPETLQDLLMGRLDRVGEAKTVAQLGAAIGREFPYALLAAVAPLRESELREGLARLVASELVHQRGVAPKATFTFKHALVQDTAYRSLLESQRSELHGRIADALEKHLPDRVARAPEEIARHCERAGRTGEAIGYYERAGKHAARRFAHAEAIDHLQRAIALLGGFAETPERNQRELSLQLALGMAMHAARGHAHRDIERIFGRARELSREVGGPAERFSALFGLATFHSTRGSLQTAYDLEQEALALAEKMGDPSLLVVAHARLGVNLANQGELIRALEHLEQAIALHDPAQIGSQHYGQGVQARFYAARTLFQLGHPDQARRRCREAIELARSSDPPSAALMFMVAATLHYRRRERDPTRELAEEAIAIAKERGLPFPLAIATAYRGWAIGGQRGLDEIQKGVAQFAAIGAESSVPHGLLAEAYRELGRNEDALAELEAAFATRSETRTYDAELYRVRGEVLAQQGALEEAQDSLRRALEVARAQQAKSLELRSATSLARLLRDEGRCDEARALLAPIYDWFTEGFDTADLKDAKALLETLEETRATERSGSAPSAW